ncbi:MAG: hypothetical protein RLZZ361_1533 [Cyanobacteriota bacterium]|jgi:hypothetical protein
MSEEIVDAESSTLNKNTGPLDHLKHLLNIGWSDTSPIITKFVQKYNLEDDLISLLEQKKRN